MLSAALSTISNSTGLVLSEIGNYLNSVISAVASVL